MAEERKNNQENQYSLEEILNDNYDSDESFTLESILAEFKSQAYMDGDKRTPKDVLQRQTDQILNEVKSSIEKRPAHTEDVSAGKEKQSGGGHREIPDAHTDVKSTFSQKIKKEAAKAPIIEKEAKEAEEPKIPEVNHKEQPVERPIEQPVERSQKGDFGELLHHSIGRSPDRTDSAADVKDQQILESPKARRGAADEKPPKTGDRKNDVKENDGLDFFEEYQFSDSDTSRFEPQVSETVRRGEDLDSDDSESGGSFFGRLFNRQRDVDEEISETGNVYIRHEEEIDESQEPGDLRPEASRFASQVRPLRFKSLVSAILCILMLIVSQLFASGKNIPFGIGTSAALTTGVLLILQMLVMIACMDVLISGVTDIAKAKPGVESLVLISNVLSILDGFVMLITGNYSNGLPFSLISACSLFFTLWARKSYYMAMCDSIKSSLASSSPYGVVSDSSSIEGRIVLKKLPGATHGFYSRLIEADFSESVYNYAAPLFILLSLVFGFITSVGRGRGGDIAHTVSIMSAISAAFPAAAAFTLPFRYASVRAKRIGSAIAGWGGASDIYYSDGALLTDDDIFPVGSVSLSGLKLFEGVSQRKAIVYTSSLIIASDSDLKRVFQELLKSQGFSERPTKDFACYDGGGLGAVIDGERVLVGTGAFMNLMGIRVPESVNDKSNVFTAINGELAAVFTINYVPANSVQASLVSLLNTKTNILLAARDFNVTPNAIQQKFKVSMEGVEFVPVDTVYKLSDTAVPDNAGASSILCRGGLAPFAEVITRGRLLKTVTELNTLVSVAGTVIGLLIMLFLCWNASFSAASVTNVFIFMLVIEFCVILLSQTVRKRL